MSSQRLVFRNGFVVSMDPDIGEIANEWRQDRAARQARRKTK